MAKQLLHIIGSMRPRQWTKNLVVFAALIFSRNFDNPAMVLRSVEAFFILCLLSGVIYIVNDLADLPRDRQHPMKRNRPLASGALRPQAAVAAAVIGMLAGIYLSWRIGTNFLVVACAFFVLNFLYSFFLKRIVLLDAMSISLSFVLRAIAGVEALHGFGENIEISPWLLICTLFLSLFLAFCKRRHELLFVENPGNHRETLQEYSPALLDQLVGISAGGSVLSYALYTIWPETVEKFGTSNLVYTVPLVLIGVMRYLYLVYTKEKGGSPSDLLLHERFILIDVVLWILLVVLILGGA
ncbi:MAG: decaprenyl-phosphate phosphoribosyltransferase [Candidatus Krumholzibacteria bacterium]|nr:decaprenyl-phosphate phosphoribosyltransferase [Candidatus Krumholzibacteria bacterium]MDH4337282.1 decaprenyl-phosphate phosphoribosyltransferase [Candidatus Krumholzibacteria bacterium]MDH5270005.1 decaprenyl-phosphate phosphoribosyltransferase [Candidatus Krumholzibacteria bacterium]